jgi:hypothetical protein
MAFSRHSNSCCRRCVTFAAPSGLATLGVDEEEEDTEEGNDKDEVEDEDDDDDDTRSVLSLLASTVAVCSYPAARRTRSFTRAYRST